MNKKTLQLLLLTSLFVGTSLKIHTGPFLKQPSSNNSVSTKKLRRLAKEKKIAKMQQNRSPKSDPSDYDMGLDSGYSVEKFFTTSALTTTVVSAVVYFCNQQCQ
jgi:hypothetical protein